MMQLEKCHQELGAGSANGAQGPAGIPAPSGTSDPSQQPLMINPQQLQSYSNLKNFAIPLKGTTSVQLKKQYNGYATRITAANQ